MSDRLREIEERREEVEAAIAEMGEFRIATAAKWYAEDTSWLMPKLASARSENERISKENADLRAQLEQLRDALVPAGAEPDSADVLLIVALKTDQPNIERRLRTILATAEPVRPDTEPCAYARTVKELVASDLDALAALIGWSAVSRLRVGEVAAPGLPDPAADRGIGDDPGRALTIPDRAVGGEGT